MAYFSELDDKNIVTRTIVVHDDDAVAGASFCNALFGGRWIQTYDDHSKRKQYAGVGYTYDAESDVFIAPQPYPSWTLDDNYDWIPPFPMPAGNWSWNESDQSWVEINAG